MVDTWTIEEKISAFKVFGYIDINVESDTEITFQYVAGNYNKSKNALLNL